VIDAHDASLLLIDGHALAYRSFFGIRNLSTRDGRPTNALFGFIRAVEHLTETWRPTQFATVFDAGLPEERMRLLPEYKAQRARMPDELRQQLPLLHAYLDTAGLACLEEAGQEADDIIATLATTAAGDGARVLIVSSDKDLFQLVGPRIHMVSSGKGATLMGADEVRAKTGVAPDRICDWLALVGDTADNIPGLPGVGAKTAAKWLNEYGTLNGILERMEDVQPARLRERLKEYRDRLERNLELVRLRTDLHCSPWDSLLYAPADQALLNRFYEQYELNSLIRLL